MRLPATDRVEDWIKARSWGIDVQTLDELRIVIGKGRAADPVQVAFWLKMPAARPMPPALLAETVAWLNGNGLASLVPVWVRRRPRTAAFDESLHPRDERGRFGEGTSAPVGPETSPAGGFPGQAFASWDDYQIERADAARAALRAAEGASAVTAVERWMGSAGSQDQARRGVERLIEKYGRANAEPLYRGGALPGTPDEVVASVLADGTIEIPTSSFSTDRDVAAKFGHWDSDPEERAAAGLDTSSPYSTVLIRVEPGETKELALENLAHGDYFWEEHEHATGGTFQVVSAHVIDTPYLDEPRPTVEVVVKAV